MAIIISGSNLTIEDVAAVARHGETGGLNSSGQLLAQINVETSFYFFVAIGVTK